MEKKRENGVFFFLAQSFIWIWVTKTTYHVLVTGRIVFSLGFCYCSGSAENFKKCNCWLFANFALEMIPVLIDHAILGDPGVASCHGEALLREI